MASATGICDPETIELVRLSSCLIESREDRSILFAGHLAISTDTIVAVSII